MRYAKLDEAARRASGADFAELSAGFTRFELSGREEGPRVLLVHGNAAPLVSWDRTAPALAAAGFRVLRFDLFGHGLSDRPALERYDRDFYDRQVEELLAALGWSGPLAIAGTSQGGAIAARFAAKRPTRVVRLALLSPFVDSVPGKALLPLLRRKGLGELFTALTGTRPLAKPEHGFARPADAAELAAKLGELLRYEGRTAAFLANLRGDALEDAGEDYAAVAAAGIPTFLSWGSADASIPAASIARLRGLVPGLEYHEFPGAGHLLHYEFAELLNPLLSAFFRG